VSSEGGGDFLEFRVDNVYQDSISGTKNGWASKTYAISGDGPHTLLWSYKKDGDTAEGRDCAWLDCVSWVPDAEPFTTTPTPVPYSWLDEFFTGLKTAKEYEDKAREPGKNGMRVWESFVVDCDPNDTDTRFRITHFELDLENDDHLFMVEPYSTRRVYRVLGKTNLTDKAWLPHPETPGLKFFQVDVSVD
jgi:hypothetical protein